MAADLLPRATTVLSRLRCYLLAGGYILAVSHLPFPFWPPRFGLLFHPLLARSWLTPTASYPWTSK